MQYDRWDMIVPMHMYHTLYLMRYDIWDTDVPVCDFLEQSLSTILHGFNNLAITEI